MNAAEHLEANLGHIDQGWSSKSLPGVQVCLFRNQPTPGVLTLATLGLSEVVLSLNDGKSVRQELLMAVRDELLMENVAKLLLEIAEQVLQTGRALLRGQVLDLHAALWPRSEATSVYVSMPVVFGDSIETLNDTTPPTVFAWLFPILPGEMAFVSARGWGEFEKRLEAIDPDLYDPLRSSAVTP